MMGKLPSLPTCLPFQHQGLRCMQPGSSAPLGYMGCMHSSGLGPFWGSWSCALGPQGQAGLPVAGIYVCINMFCR